MKFAVQKLFRIHITLSRFNLRRWIVRAILPKLFRQTKEGTSQWTLCQTFQETETVSCVDWIHLRRISGTPACLSGQFSKAHGTIHPGRKRTSETLLRTIEDKLLFILMYLRKATPQDIFGEVFKMSQPKADQWIHILHPCINDQFEQGRGELLGRYVRRKARFLAGFF